MLRFASQRLTPRLTLAPSHSFSVFKALLHLIRTSLNRVRWEENQQFTEL